MLSIMQRKHGSEHGTVRTLQCRLTLLKYGALVQLIMNDINIYAIINNHKLNIKNYIFINLSY
jgi:hypothetical protein